jgi:hypothetical protein
LFLWAFLGCALVLLSISVPVQAEVRLETRYALVIADSHADLQDLARRLAPTEGARLFRRHTPAGDADPGPLLTARLDGIVLRASEVLRLPPPSGRVRIFLLKDGVQVRQRYLLLSGESGSSLHAYTPLEAFYEAGTRTIFLSLADARPGVVAHEAAHFLMCTVMAPAPPAHLQDEWARFTETQIQ